MRSTTLPAIAAAARTAPPDLLACWEPGDFLMERQGLGVLGAGVARTVLVPAGRRQAAEASRLAEAALAARAEARSPSLVVGAIPFGGEIPAHLAVPARVLRTWRGLSTLEPARPDAKPPGLGPTLRLPAANGSGGSGEPEPDPSRAAPPPLPIRWVAEPPAPAFAAAVTEALRHIDAGELEKVVLARSLLAPNPGLDLRALLAALRRSDPGCHLFAASAGEGSVFLGATPEPRLTTTSAVWHLATVIRGRLRSSAPGVMELAAALHPTPAVCGTPADRAAELIRRLEPQGRGLYAGLVGWMDGRGDGEWVLGLRCALVTPEELRLQAGGGIVAGSDPAAEVAETESKFLTLLDALQAIGAAAER